MAELALLDNLDDETRAELDRLEQGVPDLERIDPDDSFRDSSTVFGWVIGLGVETLLADAWALRLEGTTSSDDTAGPIQEKWRRPTPFALLLPRI